MGKILLVYVLFLIIVNTTWETKVKVVVKRDYTSKMLSNIMINFISQRTTSVTSDIVNINIGIASDKKQLIIFAYKLKNLSSINQVIYITNIMPECLVFLLMMLIKVFPGIVKGQNTLKQDYSKYVQLTYF